MTKNAKLLLTSSRPLSWINTAFPFAAGYYMMSGRVDATLIIGSLFFLIPYNLLMYGINDVYDYESDLRNPRKGGVEGAVVPKQLHRFLLTWSYLLPVPFVIWLVIAGHSLTAALVLLGCLFFVVAYSAKGLRFKEIPILDSITSSLHFVGPLIYALSLVGWPAVAWPIVIAFFFWGMASQSLGAIQDIIADREAGIKSIATVFGARKTVFFSLSCYLLASILLASLGGFAILLAVLGLIYAFNLLPFIAITDQEAEKTRAAWKRFLWINYLYGAAVTFVLITITVTA